MTARVICDCDLSDEEWRDIPGLSGYKASNHGRILSESGAVMSLRNYGNGYWGVTIRRRNYYAHRLVCLAFHGEPPSPVHQTAHSDGTRRNNHPDNLRWATPSENNLDSVKHGTSQALRFKHGGEEQAWHKLTWEKVDRIFELRAAGWRQRDIGRELGVSKSTVGYVLRGEHWSDRPASAGPAPTLVIEPFAVDGVKVVEIRETHCKRGHEFTPENTGRQAGGHRFCRLCKREVFARYRARKAAALADHRDDERAGEGE